MTQVTPAFGWLSEVDDDLDALFLDAERRLDALSPQEDRIGISDEARRQLGRIRTSLEYRSTSDVIADLPAQMLRVQGSVMAASQAVASRYFQSGQVTTWTRDGVV